MSRIVMLLSNAYRPDPRVEREAGALIDRGHQVSVVAWDREGEKPEREILNGVEIYRIKSIPTAYGAGWRQLFYTPRFWRAAVRQAAKIQPEVVHCHDLDTLYAGAMLKGRSGCKLVYDAHENYPALMSLYLPGLFLPFLTALENRLLHRVDYTITASTVFEDELRSRGVHPVTTIGNYQRLAPFDAVTPEQIADRREELGLSKNDFVVVYIGGFTRNRMLLPLIEAARFLPDTKFLLWGDGHQRQSVEAATKEAENVRYLGWLPSSLVPLHSRLADVVYYCLLPDYPGAVYNAPNTLSNAMAAGTPVLANDIGDLGRIVHQTGCGVLLESTDPASIAQALTELKDASLRSELGHAGRLAAEREYNWSAASEKLERIYRQITEREPLPA